MTTHLYDVVDQEELAAAIEAKHVREQFHPSEPLAILNYTEACVYDNAWNPTTLACRGLIYNTDNGDVVARPFAKFFNYGQAGAADIPLDANVIVTDKVDGSLGILYRRPSDGYLAIATRGSFTSDQALHATQLFREKYDGFTPLPEDTLLFEIVYPENRIVLDYGSTDDLILLGSVEIARGFVNAPETTARYHGWEGDRAKTFVYQTLAQALAAEPRENAEGMVVHHPGLDRDLMVKLKQEDYVRLHRLVTGLSERSIWEQIIAGASLRKVLDPLPDEFHDWVCEVYGRLNAQVGARRHQIGNDFRFIIGRLEVAGLHPNDAEFRKTFAGYASETPHPWALFSMLDEKPILPKLWDQAKPAPFLTPSGRTYTEDAA